MKLIALDKRFKDFRRKIGNCVSVDCPRTMSCMRTGKENVCDKSRSFGIYTDGGYTEYLLVLDQRYLVKLSKRADIDPSATRSCSARASYGAVRNSRLKPHDAAIIVGASGPGLMATQLTEAVSGAKIITVDIDDSKL